jgi:hypothetical protein
MEHTPNAPSDSKLMGTKEGVDGKEVIQVDILTMPNR